MGSGARDLYYNLPFLDSLEHTSKMFGRLEYDTFERMLFNLTHPEQRIILQDAAYGSWNDTHAYCLSHNSSPATLTPMLSRQLKSLVL